MGADRSAMERRTRTQALIKKLTAERTQTLVLFCRVAGLEPYTAHKKKSVKRLLQEFCQVLVDYIAAGHFVLYERILNGEERRQEAVRLAERLYPQIAATTDTAIAFNDKYDPAKKVENLDQLWGDLSRLGEAFAHRIALEDQLIKALLARR